MKHKGATTLVGLVAVAAIVAIVMVLGDTSGQIPVTGEALRPPQARGCRSEGQMVGPVVEIDIESCPLNIELLTVGCVLAESAAEDLCDERCEMLNPNNPDCEGVVTQGRFEVQCQLSRKFLEQEEEGEDGTTIGEETAELFGEALCQKMLTCHCLESV